MADHFWITRKTWPNQDLTNSLLVALNSSISSQTYPTVIYEKITRTEGKNFNIKNYEKKKTKQAIMLLFYIV